MPTFPIFATSGGSPLCAASHTVESARLSIRCRRLQSDSLALEHIVNPRGSENELIVHPKFRGCVERVLRRRLSSIANR